MSDFFTQEQLDVLSQSIRRKKIKIEILNHQFQVIDTIEGETIGGSIDLDANSDYRRSCNLTLVVSDLYSDIIKEKYIVGINSLIWLDKYVKIYVGIYNEIPENFTWFNCGIFIIDEPSYNYSITDNVLKFNGMDLMYELSENRYGQLTDYETKILAENNNIRTEMRDVFIKILNTYTNVTNYYIAPLTGDFRYLPEDVVFNAGETIYGMLLKLLEYLPGWEMFFNEDGYFILQPIPKGIKDTVYPLNPDYTSVEEVSVDFNNVKNLVVVRGRTHDSDYYFDTSNISYLSVGNDLFLVINIGDSFEYNGERFVINDNTIIGFTWLDNEYNPINPNDDSKSFNKIRLTNGINIQDLDFYDFENTRSYIPLNTFQPGSINIIRYNILNNSGSNFYYFDYLSNGQANAFSVNEELDSPYYINAELKGENYYGGLSYCENHLNYIITLNNTKTLSAVNHNVQITFMPNITNNAQPNLTVKDGITGDILLSEIPITYKDESLLQANEWSDDNTIYLLKYDDNAGCFILQGRHQTYTYYLSGGEYENIYSNSLAKQRADYELYLRSNLNDNVIVSTIPNYYMDVNKKIFYRSYIDKENSYYLTKKITLPLDTKGSLMSSEAVKIYPDKYYITTSLEGCEVEIIDNEGNNYLSGDEIKLNTVLTINLKPLDGFTEPFTITINGNSYMLNTEYIVKGNVNIVATATIQNTIITINNNTGNTLTLPLNIYKYSTDDTFFYVNNSLFSTSVTQGTQDISITFSTGENVLEISGGNFYIDDYCFGNSVNNNCITSVVFGYNYREIIGSYAFADCRQIQNINITSYITTVNTGAFIRSGIKKITIGENVSFIGSNVFGQCRNLISIYYNAISCADKTNNSAPFVDIGNNATLYVGKDVTRIPAYMFAVGTSSQTNRVPIVKIDFTQSRSLTSIGDYAFYYGAVENLELPDSLRTIGLYSFGHCENLKTLYLGKNLTTISNYAFDYCRPGLSILYNIRNCENLSANNYVFRNTGIIDGQYKYMKIETGAACRSIPSYLFHLNCYVGQIKFSEGVKNIGANCFPNNRLTSIELPSTVSYLGAGCFSQNSNMGSITLNSQIPPQAGGNNFFDDTNNCPIYVPSSVVENYKQADRWTQYATRIQPKQ